MVLHYRETDSVSGRWTGNTSGVPLSSAQGDENIYTLDQAIATVAASVTASRSISSITQSGNTFTFHMSDSTLEGPFTIPEVTFLDRGAWAALTSYSVNDTFNINGTLYLVIFAHTSASTFSAGANDGMGHNYYSAMISTPGNALPTGGAARMNLKKSTSADFAVTWGFDLASDVTFSPSTASGLTSTNVSAALEEVEAKIAISGCSDVTHDTPASGDVLTWVEDTSGNSWRPKATSGGGATTLDVLTDVNVSEGSGIDGFYLKWDNGTSKWIAGALGTASTHDATDFQTADAQLFSNIPQNSQSANYTAIATDAQKHIFHPSADTTARTYTIPSNASVAYPVGTALTFVNQHSAGVITIAITSDTLWLAGVGTTGSRTLAADGFATALKITSTEWIISGAGLS